MIKPIPELTDRDRERFWSHVERRDGCWPWTSYKNANGYGRLNIRGMVFLASRVAWRLATDVDPAELCVCHKCDNPACVNPGHLFLGTIAENNRDCVAKGRARRGRVYGSEHPSAKLSEENVSAIRGFLEQGKAQTEIARQFGVTNSTIWMIAAGRNWKHLGCAIGSRRARLTETDVAVIRGLLEQGGRQRAIARLLGVSHTVVWRIAQERRHKLQPAQRERAAS